MRNLSELFLDLLLFMLILNVFISDFKLAKYIDKYEVLQEQVDSLQKQINFMVE